MVDGRLEKQALLVSTRLATRGRVSWTGEPAKVFRSFQVVFQLQAPCAVDVSDVVARLQRGYLQSVVNKDSVNVSTFRCGGPWIQSRIYQPNTFAQWEVGGSEKAWPSSGRGLMGWL